MVAAVIMIYVLFLCLLWSCDSDSGSPDEDDVDEINSTWTGLILSGESQYPVPVIAEFDSSEKTYSMRSFVHGKEDQIFEGTYSEDGSELHLLSHCEMQTEGDNHAPGDFICDCTMTDGVTSGTYSLRFDDETIAAEHDEDGTIQLSNKDLGIVGTWKGGWSGEQDESINGSVTVIFKEDNTVSVTGRGIAFSGTWSVSNDEFSAQSSGKIFNNNDSHDSEYSAKIINNTLFAGKYTVVSSPDSADATAYSGVWALGKVIE